MVLVEVQYLVSHGGPYGFVEELDADDWEQTDARGQNDGQPQVGLPQGIGSRACQPAQQHGNVSMLRSLQPIQLDVITKLFQL